jgi:hypothetical protein
MDVLAVMGLVLLLVFLGAVAALTVGGVPERKPPTAPRLNGDFDIWPFF